MNQDHAIGLDIGGANLKVANAGGRAVSKPFELWKHPERLTAELRQLAELFPDAIRVGVTMTGELCDCFPTRRDGVRHILAAIRDVFGDRARVWGTDGRFHLIDDASASWLAVAAANWHAQATFVGRFMRSGHGLLVDTGSTTTDVIPLRAGVPVPAGRTDPERLESSELVYTGAKRTPMSALGLPNLAAEWFATTHDVYVLLGLLPEESDNRSTADGRPMTVSNAHARLARMLGGDSETIAIEKTRELAESAFQAQKALIGSAVRRVIERTAEPTTIYLSGSGEFLARAALEQCGLPTNSFAERIGPSQSEAACAYAVAVLAAESW